MPARNIPLSTHSAEGTKPVPGQLIIYANTDKALHFVNEDGSDVKLNLKGFVNHGAVASTPRPQGYVSVEWYGSVVPTNAVLGDTWTPSFAVSKNYATRTFAVQSFR